MVPKGQQVVLSLHTCTPMHVYVCVQAVLETELMKLIQLTHL